MKRMGWLAACLVLVALAEAALALVTTAQARATSSPIRLVITVDDLPGTVPSDGSISRHSVVRDLVATLKRRGVPHATAFIVGGGLAGSADHRAAVEAWVQAGYEVGSHSLTHPSFAETSTEAFLRDVEENRPIIEALEPRLGQRAHYFRFPYLEEGSTPEARLALTRYLREHDTALARVSVDFDDWAYADAFVRCHKRADADAVKAVQDAYVQHGVAQLRWAEAASRALLGRPITQVLLLHANPVTAQTLDALLAAYEAEGVQYAPLAEALRDPIYRAPYATSGTNVLVQAAQHRGKAHLPLPARALSLLQLACR